MNEPSHRGHCQQEKQHCALGLLALESSQKRGVRLELKRLHIPSIVSFAVLRGLSLVCMPRQPSPGSASPQGTYTNKWSLLWCREVAPVFTHVLQNGDVRNPYTGKTEVGGMYILVLVRGVE